MLLFYECGGKARDHAKIKPACYKLYNVILRASKISFAFSNNHNVLLLVVHQIAMYSLYSTNSCVAIRIDYV